jgi:hypothetical protein
VLQCKSEERGWQAKVLSLLGFQREKERKRRDNAFLVQLQLNFEIFGNGPK